MRSRSWRIFIQRFIGVAAPATLLASCLPFLADHQSAQVLPPGKLEVTPSFSYVTFADGSEADHVRDHYGARLGVGFSERVDFRAMFEHVALDEDAGGASVNLVAVGAKFSLVPDRFAFYLPIGFVTGEDLDESETWTVAPTLLATWRGSPQFELTPSIKAIYPFASDNPEVFLGLHLGMGISSDLERWAFRPEVGLVKNPGEDGTTWGLTIGFSVRP
jgi:hypothetical protein